MKIHNKILSLLLALSIIFSSAVPVFARSPPTVTDYWNAFLTGDYSTIDEYRQSQKYENCWTAGNAGGSFQDDKLFCQSHKYHGQHGGQFQGDKNSSTSSYIGGETVYTPIINKTYNTSNNTYNYSYNNITNNSYTTYDITEINYNNEYNTYEFVTNETNYYITYSPTYVTVMYYDTSTQQNIKNDYYYQLPDGRSSYDLTADEVWGTYFIYNAINYDEVIEDDGYTKALYHFDGNLKNSAAVNIDKTPSVSSLNFKDGKFGSALVQTVTDVTERKFYYPSGISASTIEFWLYYSSTCYKSSGVVSKTSVYPTFLAYYYSGDNGDLTAYHSIDTDMWNHIALVYDSSLTTTDKWKLYVNGSYKGTTSWYSPFSNRMSDGSYSAIMGVDELRISAGKKVYTSNFTPSSQPFDTNLVLVLPETGTTNDIAIKSNIAVSDMRVGGVRPTYPTNGYVYVYLENDIVRDVQQYQTDGWYSVDAVIYQDEQWVNLYSTDLSAYTITEEDFPTTDDATGGTDDDNTGDDNTTDEDETTGLLSSIMSTISNFITGLLDILFGGILDLITVITENLTGIIESFRGIIDLLGALFGFLPDEMTAVLTSGLAVIIVCVIIKIFI